MSDKGNLDEKVKAWLEKSGLPLELSTASSFRAASWEVEHSSVYIDPQSDKGREIDVLARIRDRVGMVSIFTVVECKASPNPWIVLVDRDSLKQPSFSSLGVTGDHTRRAFPTGLFVEGTDIETLLRRLEFGGYAIKQAFGGENDPAYAAAISVSKAALAVVRNPDYITPRFHFAIPLLVVESPIFECSLDEWGNVVLKQVSVSGFRFTAHIPEKLRTNIRIVTRKELPYVVAVLRDLSNAILKVMGPAVAAALEKYKNQGTGS